MIKCPNCGATLPPSYQRCQFCQADTSKVARPVDAGKPKAYNWGPEPWMVITYNVIAGMYVFFGALQVFVGSGILTAGKPLVMSLLSGGFAALVGLSLILRWDVFKSVVYLFLALQLACGLLGMLLFSAMLKLGAGIMLIMIIYGIQVVASGMMFYLYPKINEDF